MLLICFFCAFLIVSISCLFFENFNVFLFFVKNVVFFFISFFQVGEEGVRGANPNLKLVWVFFLGGGGLPPLGNICPSEPHECSPQRSKI